ELPAGKPAAELPEGSGQTTASEPAKQPEGGSQ
ncbi:MAG: hypothetical protein QOJ03_2680, partial [Frankiaceae bacterium]|nr:hypothetical protein [Frankiaceae bacterium]